MAFSYLPTTDSNSKVNKKINTTCLFLYFFLVCSVSLLTYNQQHINSFFLFYSFFSIFFCLFLYFLSLLVLPNILIIALSYHNCFLLISLSPSFSFCFDLFYRWHCVIHLLFFFFSFALTNFLISADISFSEDILCYQYILSLFYFSNLLLERIIKLIPVAISLVQYILFNW